MYSDLLIVLLPLAIGYLIPFTHSTGLSLIHTLLGWMVYLILFLMGISLALVENLDSNLWLILRYSVVTTVAILSMNLLALLLLERLLPWKTIHKQKKPGSRLQLILESSKLLLVVLAGFLLGLSHWQWLYHAGQISTYVLIFLLFLVGIQLRNSGMTLRQIMLNWRGMLIAAVVALSALLGGIIASLLLELPIKTGLALASGYGWYSLSAIVMTETFGPIIGSTAFFNDLARELIALMLIPSLISSGRSVALGICGATSMDFTLPILQRSGGVEIVPPAVVHGFLLSLLAPVLMALFASG